MSRTRSLGRVIVFEIGTTLREARRAKGLEILECEQHTKIRGKYLRALEAEQFDLLPSPTYVRGFLKSYAEFLDLDAQLVLDEHESRFGAINPVTGEVERAGRPPRRRSRRSKRRKGRRTEAQLLWTAVGGVLGAGLLIWMGIGGTAEPVQPIPAAEAVDTAAEQGPPAPQKTEAGAPTGEGSRAEAELPRGEAPQRLTIVVSGVGEGSYAEVRGRDETGHEVFRGTLDAGQTRTYTVSRGIWVRSGNTEGLKVSVNGRDQELSGGVADFLVTASGIERISG